jgi:hypothetical protein
MRNGLREATIRVFEPNELARSEKERLLGALEAFANLGDSLEEFLAFGKQHPTFFPVPIKDNSQISWTPLPAPSFESGIISSIDPASDGKKLWTKAVAWEPVCHKLVLFCRDCLRYAWHPPYPGPHDITTGEEFEILLGLETGHKYADREEALQAILAAHDFADVQSSPIMADWKSGGFIYIPGNDFQRAVYILFREGWRVKACVRCSRRFIADKPVQRYCSTECSGETKRERNLDWWNKHGKKWRTKRKASSRHKGKKSVGKRGE